MSRIPLRFQYDHPGDYFAHNLRLLLEMRAVALPGAVPDDADLAVYLRATSDLLRRQATDLRLACTSPMDLADAAFCDLAAGCFVAPAPVAAVAV